MFKTTGLPKLLFAGYNTCRKIFILYLLENLPFYHEKCTFLCKVSSEQFANNYNFSLPE